MISRCWKVVLMDHDDADRGVVVTQKGEVIAQSSVDEQGWYDFVTDSDERRALRAVRVGCLCLEIGEWLAGKPANLDET